MMARAALAVLVILSLPETLKGREQAPWLGEWQLNAARSSARTTSSPYRRVTLRIEPAGDGLTVIYDMVGVRGGVTHHEWTGKFDGRDYPVQGSEAVITNAYRLIDERSYEIAVKLDGMEVARAVATVSPDGQTLTVVTTERGPDGRTLNTTAVYERQ